MVLQEGVFTSDIDGYSVRVGKIDNKTNTLHDILIYDHTNNKTNESVTVADSGFLNITEDKNYMVLTLYNGENFSEESMESGKTNYPFRRDRFYKQVLNVRVMNFDFQRRDENVFRNSYRMLNIKQLMYAKDSLETDYKLRVRNFVLNTRYMSHLNLRLYARMMKNDSLLASYAADSIKYIDPAILLPGTTCGTDRKCFITRSILPEITFRKSTILKITFMEENEGSTRTAWNFTGNLRFPLLC